MIFFLLPFFLFFFLLLSGLLFLSSSKNSKLTVAALESFVNSKDYVSVLLALVQIMIDYSTTKGSSLRESKRARLLGDESWQFLQVSV